MLIPAIIYKAEIQRKFQEYTYSNDMIYYTGYLGNEIPTISENNDGYTFQYAIVKNSKLIGYFTYCIDWYTSCASRFGLFSFDRGNKVIGLDIYREMKKIISDYRLHRIEWRMIGGNPVEKHYDRFCNKFNGKKHILTDAVMDRQGKYHDDIIYEIILIHNSRNSG